MVIYVEGPDSLRADYYDSEGHVIRYAISVRSKGEVEFLSEPIPGQPRYRITYSSMSHDRVLGRFDIAPPGKPESFSTYLQWAMVRSTTKAAAKTH